MEICNPKSLTSVTVYSSYMYPTALRVCPNVSKLQVQVVNHCFKTKDKKKTYT
jgi:hypothetical protein